MNDVGPPAFEARPAPRPPHLPPRTPPRRPAPRASRRPTGTIDCPGRCGGWPRLFFWHAGPRRAVANLLPKAQAASIAPKCRPSWKMLVLGGGPLPALVKLGRGSRLAPKRSRERSRGCLATTRWQPLASFGIMMGWSSVCSRAVTWMVSAGWRRCQRVGIFRIRLPVLSARAARRGPLV